PAGGRRIGSSGLSPGSCCSRRSRFGCSRAGGVARKTRSEDDSVARIDVVMPQMGESIAEGTLSKWLKKVGDSVKRDEPMFEISTDKVDAEIPAPTSGVIAEILVNEGQTVPVDTLVARLETDVNAAVVAPAAPATAPAAAPAAAPAEAAKAKTA